MLQLRWMWKNMGSKRKYFVMGLMIAAITAAMQVINPFLMQKLIDEVVLPQSTRLLLPILGIMLAVQLSRLLLRYLMVVLLEINSQTMVNGVRTHVYNVLQNQDYRFYGRMRTGDLMTRVTNDLDLIRHCQSWICYNIIDCVTVFAVALTFLCTVNLQFALCLAAVTPFVLILTRIYSKIIHPKFVLLRKKLSELNTVAQENIAGNRVVKAFAREEYEKQRFEEKNKAYGDENMDIARTRVKIQPFISLLSQMLTVITLLVGGLFMINGKITAGEMMAFSSLTWALANPLQNLGMLINDAQRFFTSSAMVMELFYSQPIITEKENAIAPKERMQGKLTYENVSLTLNNKAVLDNVSLSVPAGSTLGIMGTTGSGKTMLVSLLNRTYDVTGGTVKIDDIAVGELTLSALRRTVSIAMQDVFLFSDTVEGNIAYSDESITEDEVQAAAKMADANSFITHMSEGYDTIIGERGVGLSGGQRQRIALARTLAAKPSVLVLDDVTSALDMETEQYIQNELKALDFPCTKIIIAQRISSVQNADNIIVMDEGKIAEQGTHEELLRLKGRYYHIWALQNDVSEVNADA